MLSLFKSQLSHLKRKLASSPICCCSSQVSDNLNDSASQETKDKVTVSQCCQTIPPSHSNRLRKDSSTFYITLYKQTIFLDDKERTNYRAKMTFISSSNQICNFSYLDLYSFEVMHGMSRVCKMLPEKLETAIAINQEFLKDEKDDGSFFIDLVDNLISFFSNKLDTDTLTLRNLNYVEEPILTYQVTSNTSPEKQSDISFQLVLSQLSNILATFKTILPSRNIDLLNYLANFITEYCNDFLACFNQYEKDIHPRLLNARRRGFPLPN